MNNNKKNNEVGRREFLGKAIGATLSLAVVPSILTCACDAFASNNETFAFGTVTVDLNATANKALLKDSGSAYVPIPGNTRGLIVNRISQGNFVAMTSICTHKENRVLLYNSDVTKPDTMPCIASNHGPSQYDIFGEVVTGPAILPLQRYPVTFDGDHTLIITDTPAAVNETNVAIAGLEQNYPNPFSSESTIRFTLSETSFVSLHVKNILGEEMQSHSLGKLGVGDHSFSLDGSQLATGTYFYELRTERGSMFKQMEIIR
jgi:Rieske Fe-S protein